jgi:predicted Zn-dependent peptidase
MAAYIVNHILGGGSFSSRLYREVREKRGLAYSVYSQLVWLDHAAMLMGGTGTRAERAGDTSRSSSMRSAPGRDGPTDEELANAKSYLKGPTRSASTPRPRSPASWCRLLLDDSRHRLYRTARWQHDRLRSASMIRAALPAPAQRPFWVTRGRGAPRRACFYFFFF